MGRQAGDQAAELRQYDLNASNIDRHRDDQLRAIQEDRQREIAMAALNLRALKPLYG